MKQLMMILMCALCALSCRRVPLYDAESGVYLKLNIHIHADIDLPEDIASRGGNCARRHHIIAAFLIVLLALYYLELVQCDDIHRKKHGKNSRKRYKSFFLDNVHWVSSVNRGDSSRRPL